MSIQPAQGIIGISRRKWLGLTIGVGAIALGGAYISKSSTQGLYAGNGASKLQVFDLQTAATLGALAQAVLPLGDGFPSIGDAKTIERIDEEVYFVSPEVRDDIKTAIRVIEYMPFIYGYFTRFSALDVGSRLAVLEKAFQSRFEIPRAVSSSLRLMVQLFYFGSSATWTRIGYDGPFAKVPPQMSEQRGYFAKLKQGEQS